MFNKNDGYTDAPKKIAEAIRTSVGIVDDLPPPCELIFKEPKTKITIALNNRVVNYFKESAKKSNVKYQTMINKVLDAYMRKFIC
jgi:uncharacterized protein (DUF4415 family)